MKNKEHNIDDYFPKSLEEAKAELIRVDRVVLSDSFYEFVKAAWHLIEPGVPLVDNWHIKALCDHLQAVSEGKIKKLIINVPPRTGKSSVVSVLWPAWEWTRDPTLRWMIASYAMKLSLRDSLRRREVISSTWYQERWGDKVQLSRDQKEKSNFKNTAQGIMYCTATEATVTGMGGMRLLLDDPQDPQGAESEVVREGTIEWLNRTWPSRKDSPDAAEVLIQQRLHEQDATGIFLGQGGWVHLKIPMEFKGESNTNSLGYHDPRHVQAEVIDPIRFPPEFLEDLKKRLGPYGVAGQLQQEPAPQEGGIIKRKWINHYEEDEDPSGWHLSLMNGRYRYDPWAHMRFVTVDPAFREEEIGGPKKGQKSDPDYTAIGIWSVFETHKGPTLCLLDLINERMEAPDLIAKLKAINKEWEPAFIAIETIGAQLGLLQYAKRAGIQVREISTRADADVIYRIDKDKTARAYAATPLMADGRFWAPTYQPWLSAYISQLTTFPNATHDDMVDITSAAIAIAEKYKTPLIDTDDDVVSGRRSPDDGINRNSEEENEEANPYEGLEVNSPF